jgi:hypothetical protein
MTRSEYQELVEFLGGKFSRIDGQFAAVDRRFEALEVRLARVEVTVEENRHLIQTVAEGLAGHRENTDREFAAVRAEMAEGFRTQGELIQDLTRRLDRWERRFA